MVPCEQMYKLHAAQRSSRSELAEFPTAHHMDAYDVEPEAYWTAVTRFMRQYVETL